MERTKFLEYLTKLLKKTSKVDKLNWNDNFNDLSIDSLDLMKLIVSFEDEQNFHFDDDKLVEVKTPNDLYNLYLEITKKSNDLF